MSVIQNQTPSHHSSIISIFLTNLGKYNEGFLIGEWLALPTTADEIKECFKRINIDAVDYEEYFLTDYESEINGITYYISEYSNLNELNYLASKLEQLSFDELRLYETIIETGDYVNSIKDLINLTDNLDCYELIPNVQDESDLGYYWIEESGCYDLSKLGNLISYFDYEKFGYDITLEQGGGFTSQGYIYLTDEPVYRDYDGQLIPDEYRLLF
ncbi:antirestriction protein ArdA [Orbus wheelerorum]|uniref:antirestriction protein ArdA n=1 Tax=Orbus wheelerorum TaxID=3074111 RepID=UPI00370DB309